MKLRPLLAASLIIGVSLGAAGCNMITPQATTHAYDSGQGSAGEIGDVLIRNAMLIAGEDGDANLVVSLVNGTDEPLRVRISAGDDEQIVTAEPGVTVLGEDDQLIFTGIDETPGANVQVLFEPSAGGDPTSLAVQLFPSDFPGLEDYAPES